MKKILVFFAAIAAIFTITYFATRKQVVTVDVSGDFSECAAGFKTDMVDRLNDGLIVTINGISIEEFGFDYYVSDTMKLVVEADFLKSLLNASVQEYPEGKLLVMKGDKKLEFKVGKDRAILNGQEDIELEAKVKKDVDSDKIMIPIDDVSKYLGYSTDYYYYDNHIDLALTGRERALPSSYDMRDYGRVTEVRDQGRYGTCWAFASLGALETTLLPKEYCVFSTDNMTLTNSYNLDIDIGGEHTMSIAYLAAWQGPVYEKDDPYGDGKTDDSLKAVKHLEEALIINDKDMDILKSAIFRYGAVETSIYCQMEYVDSVSMYYSRENAAYYYDGDEGANHDVVVVGWDDNFPKENFTIEPKGDGAFICKNSWGEEFGEDGYFYVSYYDNVICNKSVVYTKVGEADNFDKIYQSDLLGWVGLMGFNKEDAFFANVYETDENEELEAVSFYATDKDTSFEVYLVQNYKDESSFDNRELLASGSMKYAGYYTVRIPEPVRLSDKSKYAVVVKIHTPKAIHPIAIEYDVDERTENFDITDGEGYISLYGESWHSAEKTQNCNVCLKAFTNYVSDGDEEEIDKE